MKVILQHHLSLIGVIHVHGRLLILICLHYFFALFLMGFSSYLSGIPVVASLSCNSFMVKTEQTLGILKLVQLSQIKFYQKTWYAEFLRVR